jgi:hypothetical protein
MAARDTILNGDVTVYYNAENGRKQLKWTGNATGTRTLNEVYSALQQLFDDSAQMDDLVPFRADTPTIYRVQNQWFVDDSTVEHFTDGSLFSDGWQDGTDDHILTIGAFYTEEADGFDIGRTIVGDKTGDTGVLLDFNATRGMVFIRPDDPTQTTGDTYQHATEAWYIQADPVGISFYFNTGGAGSFTNTTTAANSQDPGDWQLFPISEVAEDYLAIGFEQEFSKIIFDNIGGTAGVDGGSNDVVWEYPRDDGSGSFTWTAFTPTDGTTGFTAVVSDGQEVTWTSADLTRWVPISLSSSAELFFVRARLNVADFSTNPVYDQARIGGIATGKFRTHGRHGAGAQNGESAWAGITAIGSMSANTKIYIFQEDQDQGDIGMFREEKVSAAKTSDSWWEQLIPLTGNRMDMLLKTKEADSIFGRFPNAADDSTSAIGTFFARQYSQAYTNFVATALSTTGGNTVVPFASGDDLNNTSGNRQFTTDAVTGVWANDGTENGVVIRSKGAQTALVQVWQVEASPLTFVDETTDANDAGTNDWEIFTATEAVGDYVAIGSVTPFTQIDFTFSGASTQGVDGGGLALAWEYSSGDGNWADLETVTGFNDATVDFTSGTIEDQSVTFAPPVDTNDTVNVLWRPMPLGPSALLGDLANGGVLYWVRARITAGSYSTNPIYDQGFTLPESNNHAVIRDISGTSPNFTLQYYLIRTQEDFANNDVLEELVGIRNMTLDTDPVDIGPGVDANFTNEDPTFGATTQDISNGAGARPYSIRIDPDSQSLAVIYERLKHITRRGEDGSSFTAQGQDGEEYLGNEQQIEYTSQLGGAFAEGGKIYDQTTNAQSILVADHDDGGSGDVIVKAIRGTYTAGNVLSDAPSATIAIGAALSVDLDGTPGAITDLTTPAGSAGTNDVPIFSEPDTAGDYFAIGAVEPFASVDFDNTGGQDGTVGTVQWQYWNGTAWASLEGVPNFVDGTSGLTAGPSSGQILSYSPPLDWAPVSVVDLDLPEVHFGQLYFIRAEIQTTFTDLPIYDILVLGDDVTATIASLRVITPVQSSPFGTFAGGSLFGAPGVALTTGNLIGSEVQSFQLVDDDGNTQIPPNTQSITVANLISGDTVAVFRRTGSAVNKTQLTLDAGNNRGGTTLAVTDTLTQDEGSQNDNSKVRVISDSGQEHRYRYDSFVSGGSTFTLAPASTGTDSGSGTNTTIADVGGFVGAEQIEVGDFVRNTASPFQFSIVTAIADNVLTVTDNGLTWASLAYSVNTFVENYTAGNNAYVPLIERIADVASESNSIIYLGDFDIKVVVRRTSSIAILPFSQDTDFTATGREVTTVRTTDTIIT